LNARSACSRLERDDLAEGGNPRAAEVAPEELERDDAFRRCRFAREHGRQVEMRTAATHDLQPRLGPIDESAAP